MGSVFNKDKANVYTIEPFNPFLRDLARGLCAENIFKDGFISDAIILLPTKRAARALAQEFLNIRDGNATILPKIRTLGDLDPEEINISDLGGFFEFPPVISPLRRLFELSQLIRARDAALGWAHDAISVLSGAQALADLLDSAQTMAIGDNGPDWHKLDDLVEGELAEHWQKSRDFLRIISEYWPARLNELGMIDAGHKQRRSIELLSEAWANNPPQNPIIIAGSTGAIPATRKLMKIVANLPNGAIILPGLDKNMPDISWRKIHDEDGHPQRALHDTIAHIGLSRDEIAYWPSAQEVPMAQIARRKILNLALSPKEATADWLKEIASFAPHDVSQGLKNLTLIEAQSEEQEADAIAIHMRETLQNIGQTCALITPNQNIAQRVCEKMKYWGIKLDVSSGAPLNNSKIGSFIARVADFILMPYHPKAIMGLLNHPFTNLGLERNEILEAKGGLEIALLRGAIRDKDLQDLNQRAQILEPKDWKYFRANGFKVKKLTQILEKTENFIDKIRPKEFSLDKNCEFLLETCEYIARDKNNKSQAIWGREAGNQAASFFANLLQEGAHFSFKGLDEAFRTIDFLMRKIVVRPMGAHPNLAILGPLEARLLHFDKYILAGLDDGIWPQMIESDPFLSRNMRADMGLLSKDLRLGLSAHDFSQLAANENVILTRAARRGGAPSVPSRWLWRLKTLVSGALGENAMNNAFANENFNALKIAQDLIPEFDFMVKNVVPHPKPPLDARPKMFSATQIESLIRDPYKIYATKVLELNPLNPLGSEISAKERGSAIHAALEILENWAQEIPNNANEILLKEFEVQLLKAGYEKDEIGEEIERLKPSAQIMVDFMQERIGRNFKIYKEQYCETILETKMGDIKIKATADRVDVDPKGYAEIWDFKTGQIPSDYQISSLMSPQIPVTAWILMRDNELGIKAIDGFGHIKLGNRTPLVRAYAGKVKIGDDLSMAELLEKTDKTIIGLFDWFSDENHEYASKPRVEFLHKTQTYEDLTDRLARRLEWADAAIEGDENE